MLVHHTFEDTFLDAISPSFMGSGMPMCKVGFVRSQEQLDRFLPGMITEFVCVFVCMQVGSVAQWLECWS